MPSERVIVEMSVAVTPLPAVGLPVVVSGGPAVAQAPSQLDAMPLSASHRYTERPALSVRNVLEPLLCASRVTPWVDAPSADLGAALPEAAFVFDELEPHAAAPRARATSGAAMRTGPGIERSRWSSGCRLCS